MRSALAGVSSTENADASSIRACNRRISGSDSSVPCANSATAVVVSLPSRSPAAVSRRSSCPRIRSALPATTFSLFRRSCLRIRFTTLSRCLASLSDHVDDGYRLHDEPGIGIRRPLDRQVRRVPVPRASGFEGAADFLPVVGRPSHKSRGWGIRGKGVTHRRTRTIQFPTSGSGADVHMPFPRSRFLGILDRLAVLLRLFRYRASRPGASRPLSSPSVPVTGASIISTYRRRYRTTTPVEN